MIIWICLVVFRCGRKRSWLKCSCILCLLFEEVKELKLVEWVYGIHVQRQSLSTQFVDDLFLPGWCMECVGRLNINHIYNWAMIDGWWGCCSTNPHHSKSNNGWKRGNMGMMRWLGWGLAWTTYVCVCVGGGGLDHYSESYACILVIYDKACSCEHHTKTCFIMRLEYVLKI